MPSHRTKRPVRGWRTQRLVLAATALATITLGGCGEDEPAGTSETSVPYRSEEKLTDGVGQPEAIDRDPTPQTGTGGSMPLADDAETAPDEATPAE